MSISIRMPVLSPSMEKGTIVKWLKKEGDKINIGDVLAEIETDKAVMEMEAFDEGTLSQIVLPEGSQDVAVNAVIAIISPAETGVAHSAASARKSELEPERAAPTPVSAVGRDLESRIVASPLAKRLAREAGLDLAGVIGSGPQGRVIRNDVEALVRVGRSAEQKSIVAAMDRTAASTAKSGEEKSRNIQDLYEAGTFESKRVDGMRRTIARRLVESKQTIPHFYLSADCEVDALLDLRSRINQNGRPGEPARNITVNDLVIKALALALQNVPDANTIWDDDQLLKFSHSDIGVVVAVEGGLYTPVVRGAERKTVSTISAEMKEYVARARDRGLRPQDLNGGSAALSNLGMYGVSTFQPIINPPHSLMLGVGAAEQRMVARDGRPSIVRSFTATLSCDHRAIDGVIGARLLTEFKRLLEQPMEILV